MQTANKWFIEMLKRTIKNIFMLLYVLKILVHI